MNKQRSNSIEMDTFTAAQSEPPTPEKSTGFHFGSRRNARMNSLGEGLNRQCHGRRRKKSVRSVYLRDGEVHAVWKPTKSSVPSPTTPTPPPSRFADLVHEVMRQHGKENLRERQKKLLSRVTATQQVLKEQNEELAAVAELTEEEEEEKEVEPRSASAPGQRDTPGKKMWQHLIKSVIDEKKQSDKDRKRNRKRSTVHFHEVVTNKVASMGDAVAGGLPSISEQGDTAPLPATTPISPQKPRRKISMGWRRQDAITPSGAIPFTEWKNHFYERRRLNRQDTMKQCKSDYNLKAQAIVPYGIPRINSENHLTFPVERRISVPAVSEMEPRSKSVSQYQRMHTKLRRSSSPDAMDYNDYDDQGEISDTSVALDDIFSPLSSRSVSPSVFSDEEEQQRSKLQSRTPSTAGRAHQPLVKLNSEETRLLGNPSNLHKRVRNHYRQQHKGTTPSGDDIIEIDQPEAVVVQPGDMPAGFARKRPKRVSISLPTSPRGTPSPRPSTPSGLTTARVASPTPTDHTRVVHNILASPTILNERISQEQRRRESLPHLLELDEEEPDLPYNHRRATTPDIYQLHNSLSHRRSSTPTILSSPTAPPADHSRSRRIATSSPPPPSYVPLLSGSDVGSPSDPGEGRRYRLYTPTGNRHSTETTV